MFSLNNSKMLVQWKCKHVLNITEIIFHLEILKIKTSCSYDIIFKEQQKTSKNELTQCDILRKSIILFLSRDKYNYWGNEETKVKFDFFFKKISR